MKRARMILLILSVIVLIYGVAGLIVVSNREPDRHFINMHTDQRDMWQRALWASEGTWRISESDRNKWPEIDQIALEAKLYPDIKERIRNDYLPSAEADLQKAWDRYHDEKEANRYGSNNAIILIISGALAFGVCLLWFRHTAKSRKAAVA